MSSHEIKFLGAVQLYKGKQLDDLNALHFDMNHMKHDLSCITK